ncbi:hypothetical protein ACFQ5D_09490 [Paenibacillus farraposensis]|uniref:Uncharacterized protein n=1 Tax=Paenibacillus farraposensis TaxID=2807095 RepID=A0ABW4DAW9_9BACL|nr:hypothetical protein [Paenibacillus farraposensis]MCC3379848.1 hypothetical protein [Paenibacillus farraposensis]
MIRRQCRPGGQIKEQRGAKPPGPDGRDDPPQGPDLLLKSLQTPLPKDKLKKLRELNRKGLTRSQIAKQLNIPKLRVVHELAMLGVVKPDPNNKYAHKSKPKR